MLLIKNQKEITIKKIKLGHKRLILDIFFFEVLIIIQFSLKGASLFPKQLSSEKKLSRQH